jgi:hypothetical protein
MRYWQVMYVAIEKCTAQLAPTALLCFTAFTGFALLGQNLLGGIMHACSDHTISARELCVGEDSAGLPRSWYSIYLRYWYKSTNTDAEDEEGVPILCNTC